MKKTILIITVALGCSTSTDAIPLKAAVRITGAVGIMSAVSSYAVWHIYDPIGKYGSRYEYDHNLKEKRITYSRYTALGGACLTLLTGLALYKRTPGIAIRRANETLRAFKQHPLLQQHYSNIGHFDKLVELTYPKTLEPHRAAFADMCKQCDALEAAEKIIINARDDYEIDNNKVGISTCIDLSNQARCDVATSKIILGLITKLYT